MKKVVLAYSGGLDTSVILRWLIEDRGLEVVTYTADVGQGEEVEEARLKALATGASEAIVGNLVDEFVSDFVFPALRANAVYEGYYLLGTSLARPVIAKGLVEAAAQTGADAISHGATGKGNDQVRFELNAMALDPDIKVVAPWREWDMKGRADLEDYARKHGIEVPTTPKNPYSTDANLLHVSFEGGVLEDPWAAPPEDMFIMTTDPEKAPDESEVVEITYDKGDPVMVNGETLGPTELLMKLNEIGGRHGVGRVDLVENRFIGMKNRGVYETPGGTILHWAHRAIESLTLDREVLHIRDGLIPRYAAAVYNGFWYAPERELLQELIDHVQVEVSGTARIRLYKGNVVVEGRRSERSLYSEEYATFEADDVYDQADAGAFIRLHALRLKARAHRRDS
ncbi:MAG: argininosuccinate synthase [Acidimicrobiia bacterium]|nr:argininosuccinate synthase [Acidimicrobiia bacterium]